MTNDIIIIIIIIKKKKALSILAWLTTLLPCLVFTQTDFTVAVAYIKLKLTIRPIFDRI